MMFKPGNILRHKSSLDLEEKNNKIWKIVYDV
jgi:hypothetical protein